MRSSALVIGLAAGPAIAAPALANPVAELAGRWSGWGSVKLANGTAEQVKCVATYQVDDSGGGLQQNLRCASASYKIDAVAKLSLSSGRVTGSWEERTYSASGSVSGRMTGSGFNLSIQGADFAAAMAVATSPCKQSINIAPNGFDITRIAIGLGKC
ncbi:MAG: hypothetical protein AB1749_14070 [Pseudomonadota bacterium]